MLCLRSPHRLKQNNSPNATKKQKTKDYPEGPGVLLELLQNADDAGASRAAFVLDTRRHATRSMLGPGMAGAQGAALLAYNDSSFSAADVAAIARIGQDAKAGRPAAIGRSELLFFCVGGSFGCAATHSQILPLTPAPSPPPFP